MMTLWGEETVESKKCIKCGVIKTFDHFSPRSGINKKNDIRNDCDDCRKKSSKVVKKLKEEHPLPNIDTYRCAICEKNRNEIQGFKSNSIKKHPFVLDHNHETGEFRGWICDYCNVGLSRFFDNADILKKAIKYLTRSCDSDIML
jgi:Zn ribbon nucleic-acid-binding protein